MNQTQVDITDHSQLVALQRILYSSRNPTRRWLHCTRRDWIYDALRRYAPNRSCALEIGPGSGVYLPILAALFESVVAADIEESYLHALEPLLAPHPNVTLVRDDILASGLPAGSFDLILCSEVIEHLSDSRRALAEMFRLLRADGVLILSTPQRHSILEVCGKVALLPGVIELVRRVYREPVLETGHINLLTRRCARQQVTEGGFTIQETFSSGLYLPLVAELLGEAGVRFERWLEGKVKSGPLDWLLWTQYYVAKRQ
jgi:SAM-dependent methyltransferase